MFCPLCEDHEVFVLGVLGLKAIMKCRGCGGQWYEDAYVAELDLDLCPDCGDSWDGCDCDEGEECSEGDYR